MECLFFVVAAGIVVWVICLVIGSMIGTSATAVRDIAGCLGRRREDRRVRKERERQEVEEKLQKETEQVERERQHQEPRTLAQRFFAENIGLLGEKYPPALFESWLRLEMHDGLEVPALWRALDKWVRDMKAIMDEAGKQQMQRQDRNQSIPAVMRLYEEQKRQVEASMPPGDERDTLLTELKERIDAILKKKIKELEP